MKSDKLWSNDKDVDKIIDRMTDSEFGSVVQGDIAYIIYNLFEDIKVLQEEVVSLVEIIRISGVNKCNPTT